MGRVMLTCKLPSVGLPDRDNVMASSAEPAAATAKAGPADGEAAANLPVVLTRLAAEVERKTQLARKVRQALMQPMLILLTALIAVTFLLLFVMPQFDALYAQQGQDMPQITRWVVDASKALTQSGGHLTLMTIVVISLLAALKYLGGQTRMHLHQLLLSLPLL